MNARMDSLDDLSPVKRALVQLKDMRARLEACERAQTEPIAIVGIGCRFPGAVSNAESFWELLADRRDAIVEVPGDRWNLQQLFDPDPDAPGKMYTRFGGFVEHIDRFDAAFFGITPREAAAMDPQQRMLLEVAWEALEHGGQAADRAAGTPVGVFVGLGAIDYLALELQSVPLERIDPYMATGGSPSVAAGRLAYVLGLQGPCVTVDTACSSSLVAVHLAVQSLRAGECRMALAGGASAILLPAMTVNFCRSRMMAPDGRCKTFDARADGYVRSEGCGIVVLKRLSDAKAEGDRILAVIRGSAINQDGRSSSLTAPNGLAQERVIAEALARGGVSPGDVDYVEAHGTGTSLGDPIELRALGAALTRRRAEGTNLLVGSVKTNIGHLEAAAGIAGLIKLVVALEHDEIPGNLHLRERNPLVDWRALRLDVPVERTPWPRNGHPRTAGVSSFGFSGTNAHVVVQEAPAEPVDGARGDRSCHVLTVSARTADALRQSVVDLREHRREHPDVRFADLCFTRNAGRVHFGHRLAVVAATADQSDRHLAAWLAGDTSSVASGCRTSGSRPQNAFIFTGLGPQAAGMGAVLYRSQPVFRGVIDRAAAVLEPVLEHPLVSVLYGERTAWLEHTRYAQPALFAVECALVELWRSWGITPDAVLGHSLGEDVAACAAGVFSFEDGVKMVAARARLMDERTQCGEMHAVFAPADVVIGSISAEPLVSVAAVNGPDQVVIAGEPAALDRTLQQLKAAGIKTRKTNASHACHSPLMDPILDALEEVAAGVTYSEPRLTFISGMTGRVPAPGELVSARYWRRHLREPIQFSAGVRALIEQGIEVFVEIGPDPVLIGMGRRCAPDGYGMWLPSLRSGVDDAQQMLSSLAALYATGAAVDWVAFDKPFERKRVALPTYPFERQRFWIDNQPSQPQAVDPDASWLSVVHAGRRQSLEGPLDLAIDTYANKWEYLERLATAYIARACRELGIFVRAGDMYSVDDILATRGIPDRYRRLLHRWCGHLAAHGLVRPDGTAFVASGEIPNLLSDHLVAEARGAFANDPALVEYVERSGSALAAVLTGRESPLEILFPGGSSALAEQLYEHSPVARYFNGIVRSIVDTAAATRKPLRILEVGAGTGGTTAAIAPALRGRDVSYTFTDVGPLFLDRGREKFAAFEFIDYQLFDVERDAATQGFAPHTFDVVVAANVVHATRNLDETLPRLRQLLADGGVLVLVEATEHPIWLDITTGLIGGWQRFEDAWRGDHPLLSPERWTEALSRHGFDNVETLPSAGTPACILGQRVIVARPRHVAADAAPAIERRARAANAPQPQTAIENGLLDQIRSLPPSEREERLALFVRAAVARLLRLDADRVPDRDRRLMDSGVDSLMAVELRNLLARGLGITRRLPATLIFDHPTIDAIARYLNHTCFENVGVSAPAEPSETAAIDYARSPHAAELERVDDAEVEVMLNRRLERL